MRHLWDATLAIPELHYRITLSQSRHADLAWWRYLLDTWNGWSFFLQPGWSPAPHMHLFTDASKTLGYGAFFGGRWFSRTWLPDQQAYCITYKELYPIALACSTWGHEWLSLRVEFHSDNQAVVSSLRKGSCRCSNVCPCRAICFWCVLCKIPYLPLMSKVWLTASRIPSPARISADFGHWLLKLQPSRTRQAPSEHPWGALTGAVHFYAQQPLAPATRRLYAVGQCHYHMLCSMHWCRPLPATEIYQRGSAPTMAGTNHPFLSTRTAKPHHEHIYINVGGTAVAGKRRVPLLCGPQGAQHQELSSHNGRWSRNARLADQGDWTLGIWRVYASGGTYLTYIKTPQTALLNVASTLARRAWSVSSLMAEPTLLPRTP